MAQPKPQPGKEPVTDRAIRESVGMIRSQQKRGMARYGSELMTWNGRDAGQDAQEELADLTVYLTQMRMERADMQQRISELEARCVELERERDTWRDIQEVSVPVGENTPTAADMVDKIRQNPDYIEITKDVLGVLRKSPSFIPLYVYAGADFQPARGECGYSVAWDVRLVLPSVGVECVAGAARPINGRKARKE
jgi:hypothetical protein